MFTKGHKISNRKKRTVAAYSVQGWIEDMTGNHDSFNVYRWKKPQIEPIKMQDMRAADSEFVRSCYKFRTAKRTLEHMAPKNPIPKQLR